MSALDVLQLMVTVASIALGLGAIHVGLSAERVSRYGRETLVVLGGYLLLVAGVRLLDLLDWLSPEWALTLHGLAGVVVLAIVLQCAWLTRIEHKEVAR